MASAFALGGIAGRSYVVWHALLHMPRQVHRTGNSAPRGLTCSHSHKIQYRNGQPVTHGELDEPAGKAMRTYPRSGGNVAGAESRTQTATV
jgi:hypothetical protein